MRVLLTCLQSVSKESLTHFVQHTNEHGDWQTRLSFTKVILSAHDCQRVVDIFRWRQVIGDDTNKQNENL